MVDAEGFASKKRITSWLILGLIGLVSFYVGSSWDGLLRIFATDLARTENTLNLINPNHIPLAHYRRGYRRPRSLSVCFRRRCYAHRRSRKHLYLPALQRKSKMENCRVS